MRLSKHLGIDVEGAAATAADRALDLLAVRDVKAQSPDAAAPASGEPGLFLCIELFPLMDRHHLNDLSTQQLFELASRLPERFRREWHVFTTLADAEAFSARSATLTVLPLVIEHNPLLGY